MTRKRSKGKKDYKGNDRLSVQQKAVQQYEAGLDALRQKNEAFEFQIDKHIAAGMSPQQALAKAKKEGYAVGGRIKKKTQSGHNRLY